MEFYGNNAEMIADLKGVVTIEPFAVTDREKFRSAVDKLVSTAVFGGEAKTGARWIIRTGANACGAVSASIQGLYDAIGRGEADGFTVPGLGKLVKQRRKARMGRNPATGETIKIKAKTVLKFRIAKAAKDAIL